MSGKKPTVISLFSGCGGSSLGYMWAGFRELLAVDNDANSVATFRLNFPRVLCWRMDIREVTGPEILKRCGTKKGELDILDASPPCQGFSTAGRRKVTDPRNDLFLDFVRLIRDLEPKVFLMENVSGMAKGRMRGRFNEIQRELKALPYRVKCKLMNAKWYGVPQSRQRLIWIGVHESLGKDPTFPEAGRKVVTLREALRNVPAGLGDGEFTGERLELSKQIRRYRDGASVHQGRSFNLKRLAWNQPCRTILKSVGKPDSQYGGGLIHPEENRHLTIAELKRVATFPDDFKLAGTFQEQWARIGNAVMPKFMEAIASHLRKAVLES